MGTLHKDLQTFMICCWIHLKMTSVSDKSCREKQNVLFLCSISFFQKWCHIWQHNRCICFACWITKAPDTHEQCVIFIAFPWQQLFCKCTSMLHLYVCDLSCYFLPVSTVNCLYHSPFYGVLRENGFKHPHPQSNFLRDFAASDNI